MIRYKIGFEKTKAAGVLIEERGEHMPTTYTHYRFGKDVLDALPRRIRTAMETNRELFDIGLHGPDILFYYRALIPNSVSGQGYGMHKQMADLFFERAKKVIDDADDKTMSRAYIYGFICHFALDSECHPYVEKMIQKSGIGHSEIEMEFDRYLLTEDKFDPLTYRQTEHIHATEKNAKVVAPFFDHVTAQQARKALKGMQLCHKALYAPGKTKRNLLFGAMKTAGQYDKFHGLVMSEEPNPKCREYCLLLNKLYEGAIPVAVDLIMKYQNYLLGTGDLPKRFHCTFGAGDKWEELVL